MTFLLIGGLVSWPLSVLILSRNLDAQGSHNHVFAWKVLQKPTFHRHWNSDDFSLNFDVVEEFLGPFFMSLGTLGGGLTLYDFSSVPVGGTKLRQRTSGVPFPPTVSIKMATQFQISHAESSHL